MAKRHRFLAVLVVGLGLSSLGLVMRSQVTPCPTIDLRSRCRICLSCSPGDILRCQARSDVLSVSRQQARAGAMLSVDDETGPLSDEEGAPLNLNGNVLPFENGAASRKSRTQMLFDAAHNDDVRRM